MDEVKINPARVRLLNHAASGLGPIIYWMSRDQRVHDNWALLYAQQEAIERKQPLVVIFCLQPSFLGATRRQYDFMIRGLIEIENTLSEFGISFCLFLGSPETHVPAFAHSLHAGLIVTDYSPLRISRAWKSKVSSSVHCKMTEVDAHNIVPVWTSSQKQEYGARTIRPKIHRLLPTYLTEFPKIRKHPFPPKKPVTPVDWEHVRRFVYVDGRVLPVNWLLPGEIEANKSLQKFREHGLKNYSTERNDPTANGQSNLSPYLHFGHLSAQRVALEAGRSKTNSEQFLEELIVRRELADNFCWYNTQYDSVSGFPNWAQKTLGVHAEDTREYIYDYDSFERAETHDPLWNAAQIEMVKRGKMHGYMRMYWAKKILEWTKTPEEAMEIAIKLNDRYELDGRDPNGYAGIAWSIGGLHDRPWFDRPVIGQIRPMSYNGCKKKFDIEMYVRNNTHK